MTTTIKEIFLKNFNQSVKNFQFHFLSEDQIKKIKDDFINHLMIDETELTLKKEIKDMIDEDREGYFFVSKINSLGEKIQYWILNNLKTPDYFYSQEYFIEQFSRDLILNLF